MKTVLPLPMRFRSHSEAGWLVTCDYILHSNILHPLLVMIEDDLDVRYPIGSLT